MANPSVEVYNTSVLDYIAQTGSLPVLQDFEQHTFLPTGSLVLDAGCAYGRDSKILRDRGFQVVGIDLSDAMLDEARRSVPNASFLKMDVRDMDFGDRYFNIVLCNAVLMLMPKSEAQETLNEFYRVLDTNGQLLLCVKEGRSEGAVTDSRGEVIKYNSKFRLGELEYYVSEAGFNVQASWVRTDLKGENKMWASVIGRKKR